MTERREDCSLVNILEKESQTGAGKNNDPEAEGLCKMQADITDTAEMKNTFWTF